MIDRSGLINKSEKRGDERNGMIVGLERQHCCLLLLTWLIVCDGFEYLQQASNQGDIDLPEERGDKMKSQQISMGMHTNVTRAVSSVGKEVFRRRVHRS